MCPVLGWLFCLDTFGSPRSWFSRKSMVPWLLSLVIFRMFYSPLSGQFEGDSVLRRDRSTWPSRLDFSSFLAVIPFRWSTSRWSRWDSFPSGLVGLRYVISESRVSESSWSSSTPFRKPISLNLLRENHTIFLLMDPRSSGLFMGYLLYIICSIRSVRWL